MTIDSLQTQCFKFLLKNPSTIPSIPTWLQEDLLQIAKEFFKNEKDKLNDHLIVNFKISAFTSIDLRDWSITSFILNQLGQKLTKLCLPPFTDANQNLLDILISNSELKILKLQGMSLDARFIACCKKLRNLKVLSLKKCSIDYSHLLDLFSDEASIVELELPLLDLNDKRFSILLQKCGKKLEHLRIEHAEKAFRKELNYCGRKKIKLIYINEGEIIKLENLYSLGSNCPNLKSVTFVNMHFHTSRWLGKKEMPETHYENIWKEILNPLTQLQQIKIKNYNQRGYENMLSFFETMKLSQYKRLIIEKLPVNRKTIQAIQEKNSHLQLLIKDCLIWCMQGS